MMDMARAREACAEIRRLHELQARLIAEDNPANLTKACALPDQMRNAVGRHKEALRANPGAPPPAERQKGGRRPA